MSKLTFKIIMLFIIFCLNVPICFAKQPVTHIGIDPEVVYQGSIFVVTVFSEKPVQSAYLRIFDREIKLYTYTYKWRGVIPVPLYYEPGTYRIILTLNYKDGSKEEFSRLVTVKKKRFEKRWFALKPEKQTLLSREILEEEWNKLEKVLTKERSALLLKGKFIIPTNGVITMPFGAIQYINGKKVSQHNGVDFANKEGTEILAANFGQVVFAEELRAYGKTVIIDHGQGIFTIYLHLSRIDVNVGDIVWKGKLIGYMGSTGISTGSHLHWGMSIHNVRVNPMEWVYKTILK